MADQAPTAPTGIPAVGATDDEKMKGALAYILSWLTGIIVLVIAGDNKFLKFHAWQSIIVGLVVTIISIILSFTIILACISFILFLALWIYTWYGAYLVYTGKSYRIPVVAEFVEKNLVK